MAQSEKELEKQLVELGNVLLSPPPSVTELLSLLDRVENALAKVDQTASESMKKAISPSTKALISDSLLTHSDINVKVSVASCMNEITRITAPDAPYDDDQMKEVFKLIVSSFEKLDDKTSPSYVKRTCILETVAKVRSCLVMLDLECDDLIVEMFGHFFRSIRDDHPEIIFSSMETIMILILEESEEISSDLISSILDVLKTENKEILPVSRRLAEKVVEKCASKLKPYLLPAVKSQCCCLDDYSKVVANVCHTGLEAVEPINAEIASKNVVSENDVADVPPEKAVEVVMDSLVDAPPSEEIGPTSVDSRKPVMSNGTLQKETVDIAVGNTDSKEANNKNNNGAKSDDKVVKSDAEPTKNDADSVGVEESVNSQAKVEKSNKQKGRKTIVLKGLSDPSERSNAVDKIEVVIKEPTKTDADNAVVEEAVNAQAKVEKSNKRKGRKTIVLKGLSEPSERSHADDNKEVMKDTEDQVKDCKEVESSMVEERVTDVSGSKEKEKEVDTAQKMQDNVGGDENVVDESRSKRIGRGKRKDDSDFVKDIKGDGGDTKKESQKRSAAKKAASVSEKGDKIPYDVDASNKEEDETKEVDAKRVKKSGKKVKIDIIMSEEDKKNNREDETKEVDAKRTKKSGKKVKIDIIMSEEDKKNNKEDETKEVDVKPAKKSGKKVEIDSSQHEDKNKGKDVVKTPLKSSGKKLTPKSSGKSTKDESDVKKTIQANSKRKQSPADEKASKKSKEYGAELVGTKVKVWWPHDKTFYEGVVEFFDDVKKKHTVLYNDGEVEILKLSKEKWEIVSEEHGDLEVLSFDEEGPEESSETPKTKKVKTIGEQGSKQGGKGGTSSKKGDASSSKSKATPKSGLKKKDDSKSDGKSKVKSSKSSAKSDEGKSGKSKDTKSGKKSSAPKPEDDDDDDTLKVTAKPKSKSSKSGNKSNTEGSGKVKASLKDSENEDEDKDSDMSPEPTNVSKLQKSQSAKKRKRSEKS